MKDDSSITLFVTLENDRFWPIVACRNGRQAPHCSHSDFLDAYFFDLSLVAQRNLRFLSLKGVATSTGPKKSSSGDPDQPESGYRRIKPFTQRTLIFFPCVEQLG